MITIDYSGERNIGYEFWCEAGRDQKWRVLSGSEVDRRKWRMQEIADKLIAALAKKNDGPQNPPD